MKILGYGWSFKESKKTADNTFSITFKSGISAKYPKEFEDKKDFDCYVVKEGDVSPIYMEIGEAKRVFDIEFNSAEDDYYRDHWKNNFSEIMSWEEWKWCWAISGVEFEAVLGHQMIERSIYDELGMDDRKKDICNKYHVLAEKIYDEEIANSLN